MMYYVIIDEGEVTSILSYEPSVPETAKVVQITNEQYIDLAEKKTCYFDVPTLSIVAYSQEKIDVDIQNEQQRLINAEKREFLNRTDWKVLRHIRQKALNLPTTLSDEQYLELEQTRAAAAEAIVEPINN